MFFCFQSSLIDLKEHASTLASAGLKRDSKLKSLEIAIEQKKEECSKLEAQLKKVSEASEKYTILSRIYNMGKEETFFSIGDTPLLLSFLLINELNTFNLSPEKPASNLFVNLKN